MAAHNGRNDDSNFSKEELDRLLALVCDGQLTQQDVAALERILSENDSACWDYIYSTNMLTGLQNWARRQNCGELRQLVETAVGSIAAIEKNSKGSAAKGVKTDWQLEMDRASSVRVRTPAVTRLGVDFARRGRILSIVVRRWEFVLPMLAALLLVSLTIAVLWLGDGRTERSDLASADEVTPNYQLSDSQSVVARIVSVSADVSWADGNRPADFLMRLRPGNSVEPITGRVTVEFCGGAFLVLQSPALLQVTSGDSALLLHGSVVGRAKQGNFVLLTPQATVVDIGTEFGVDVSRGNTDVSVFEGEVDVYAPMKVAHQQSVRLTRGMKISIDPQGHAKEIHDVKEEFFNRDVFPKSPHAYRDRSISLLDLLNGNENLMQGIAGSIDPVTGYWGRVSLDDFEEARARRGDTQFTRTNWNRFVDGVFVPRSNAREMQIDSDGHMVYLPPTSGTTWGPVWARRRSDIDQVQSSLRSETSDAWGSGSLASVWRRLPKTREGLMGIHANAGITYDLDAIRKATGRQIEMLNSSIVNMDSALIDVPSASGSLVDVRVFVDGKLRFSRLSFGKTDGDSDMTVPLDKQDRFLTIVATDADGDPACDHLVLVDPVLELQH